MNDMSSVIVAKSDQLNSDDLISGPVTITITGVEIRPGTEQPVSIHFENDDGKPWRPCKSMCRVMVHCWGPDANKYVGHSLTLYRDPKITWGALAVGGIRISHMTDIAGTQILALTATKGNKKPFTVQPLTIKPTAPEFDPEQLALDAGETAAKGVAAYQAFWKALPKEKRTHLLPRHESLKAIASAADEAAIATEPDTSEAEIY